MFYAYNNIAETEYNHWQLCNYHLVLYRLTYIRQSRFKIVLYEIERTLTVDFRNKPPATRVISGSEDNIVARFCP